MANVMTVRGPVPASELGVTSMHEHLFLDMIRELRMEGLLNDVPLAVAELERFRDAGGHTIVDLTNSGLGRAPHAVRHVSEETGVHVVLGCGFYRQQYFDRDWMDRTSIDELATMIIRDLTEGIDGTGIRAGIIGEIGCDEHPTKQEERSIRAAGRAHVETGATISTHAARWPVGTEQLDLLEDEGVDPARIIIGHCDTVRSTAWRSVEDVHRYHLEIARRGAYVQFDTIRPGTDHDVESRVAFVCRLLEAGHGHQVLLGQDIARKPLLHAYGGGGYDFLLTGFTPLLRKRGVSDEEIDMMLVANPRRALTGGNYEQAT